VTGRGLRERVTQPAGFTVTSLPRYLLESDESVPSLCMLATTLLSCSINDLSSGPLLSRANATDTVKIGGPSSTRIGRPSLT